MWSRRWENECVVPSMKARVLKNSGEVRGGWERRVVWERKWGTKTWYLHWGSYWRLAVGGKVGVFRTETTPRQLRRYWVLEKESNILKSLLRACLFKKHQATVFYKETDLEGLIDVTRTIYVTHPCWYWIVGNLKTFCCETLYQKQPVHPKASGSRIGNGKYRG